MGCPIPPGQGPRHRNKVRPPRLPRRDVCDSVLRSSSCPLPRATLKTLWAAKISAGIRMMGKGSENR